MPAGSRLTEVLRCNGIYRRRVIGLARGLWRKGADVDANCRGAEAALISMTQRAPSWYLPVLAAALVAPMVATLVWLYTHDTWAPNYDIALIEMRVRDVGTANTPLLGLQGRLGHDGASSHPGPLAYYLLAPGYHLLGGTYWALRASMVALNGGAILCALWAARRAGGQPALLGVAGLIGFAELGFGLLVLTEPWNPNLPVLWFVPFVVACWALSCGDIRMLPLVVAIGTLCGQTHISYIPICAGMGAAAFVLVVAGQRWRRESIAERRKQCALAALVLGVLWAPPLVEEWTAPTGNFTKLLRFFLEPRDAPWGLGPAAYHFFTHLDPGLLVVSSTTMPGVLEDLPSGTSAVRGAGLLFLWAGTAWSVRHHESAALRALNRLLLPAPFVGIVTISRMTGPAARYLLYWAWIIGITMLIATLANVIAWVEKRRRCAPWNEAAFGLPLVLLMSVRLALEADHAGSSDPVTSKQLAVLAAATSAALEDEEGAATGRDGRYHVAFSEALWGTGQGVSLVNELERRGFSVGTNPFWQGPMGRHRVMAPSDATAIVFLATGGWVGEPTRSPGAVPVAYVDPHGPREREEFRRLRARLVDELEDRGRQDLVLQLDKDYQVAERLNLPDAGRIVGRFHKIGIPAAVWILPPE